MFFRSVLPVSIAGSLYFGSLTSLVTNVRAGDNLSSVYGFGDSVRSLVRFIVVSSCRIALGLASGNGLNIGGSGRGNPIRFLSRISLFRENFLSLKFSIRFVTISFVNIAYISAFVIRNNLTLFETATMLFVLGISWKTHSSPITLPGPSATNVFVDPNFWKWCSSRITHSPWTMKYRLSRNCPFRTRIEFLSIISSFIE
jgi:hypothetical protein